MMRIRFFILLCALCTGLLAPSAGTTPAHAAALPTGNPDPTKIFLPIVTQVGADVPALPSLSDFASSVSDPSSQGVKGVYVPKAFAYRVVSQPAGNYGFVSTQADTVTEFSLATSPVEGLLGHVDLAGKTFSGLKNNQDIYLIWADGSTRKYKITGSHGYQAVSPYSASSDFIDLETGATLSAAELFVEYYMGTEHITLQTCISKNGSSNWGRLFVVAEPVH